MWIFSISNLEISFHYWYHWSLFLNHALATSNPLKVPAAIRAKFHLEEGGGGGWDFPPPTQVLPLRNHGLFTYFVLVSPSSCVVFLC